MGAFEVDTTVEVEPIFCEGGDGSGGGNGGSGSGGGSRIIDECIVAHKVYDSCRRQNCLTDSEIGPARMEEDGSIITPPEGAVSVSMDSVRIKKITVVDKQPSPFRTGYWDVEIRFDICYNLTFREADGELCEPIQAMNVFSLKTTLFGSAGSDLAVVTDMYDDSPMFSSAAPFVWAEAKALGLDAKIITMGDTCQVHVIIGLFCILKLFRLVHLNVQSKGFCVPNECNDQGRINPCEYFGELDFPMDIFSPPQKSAPGARP
jgi:hypothetical protein